MKDDFKPYRDELFISTKAGYDMWVLYPSITTLSIAHSLEVRVDSMKTDTVTLAVMKFAKHPTNTEKEKISEWLKARVGAKKLRLITE